MLEVLLAMVGLERAVLEVLLAMEELELLEGPVAGPVAGTMHV